MNQNNLDYLKDRLKGLGFKESLNEQLEFNIRKEENKFVLPVSIEFVRGEKKDTVDFNVDFSKSKDTEMYFVNKFDATLKGEDPAKDRSQTFYIDKSNSFTAKEAFNMLEGRAVHKNLTDKELKPYQAWVQLDLKQKNEKGQYETNKYHTNYGFDLEKAINQHPLKELGNPVHKERLIKSLEKGNVQSVTFINGDRETKMFIEANPQMKNLNVYNEKMEKQFQGVKKEKAETQEQTTEQSEKSSKKKDLKDNQIPSEGKKKRKGMSV